MQHVADRLTTVSHSWLSSEWLQPHWVNHLDSSERIEHAALSQPLKAILGDEAVATRTHRARDSLAVPRHCGRPTPWLKRILKTPPGRDKDMQSDVRNSMSPSHR